MSKKFEAHKFKSKSFIKGYNPNKIKNQMFKRVIFTILCEFIAILILIIKLTNIQVINTDNYKLLSDKNRIRIIPLIPERGIIFDAYGNKIVENKKIYKLIIDKTYATNILYIQKKISSILPDRVLEKVNFNNFQQAVLLDKITWEEISKLSFHIHEMPGVSVESYMERYSKNPEPFAHLIGILIDDPDANIFGYKRGDSGIEAFSNSELKGELGRKDVEVNSIGKIIKTLNVINPIPGNEIELSVIAELQEYIYNLMKEKYKAGACVVVDVNTGEIKALVSYPSFNFTKIYKKYWDTLVSDKLKPLNNRTISGLYPPGSVFKIASGIAISESVDSNLNVNCYGVFPLGDHEFHCWKKQGHGEVDLRKAISNSCDIFFYKNSQIAGIKSIDKYATILGLGEKTGIEISGESQGLIPSPLWKKSTYSKPWYPYETIISAIGQGSVLTTPIQLAKMTAIVANGGNSMNLTLFKNKTPIKKKVKISDKTLNEIREAMHDVCSIWGGTAFYNISKLKLHRSFAGKTGTSQVVRITKQQRESNTYKNELKQWEERDHALFVGFSPFESPKYAVVVILEHECSGSREAAPFGAKVLNKIFEIEEKYQKEK